MLLLLVPPLFTFFTCSGTKSFRISGSPSCHAVTKHLSYPSYYMHPRLGLYLILSQEPGILPHEMPEVYFGIRWHDCIRNTKTAEHIGLPPVMDLIIRMCNSPFHHGPGLGRTPQHIKLFSARSTSLLNVFQAAQEASGWYGSALTTTSPLLIYGDVLSNKVIRVDSKTPRYISGQCSLHQTSTNKDTNLWELNSCFTVTKQQNRYHIQIWHE